MQGLLKKFLSNNKLGGITRTCEQTTSTNCPTICPCLWTKEQRVTSQDSHCHRSRCLLLTVAQSGWMMRRFLWRSCIATHAQAVLMPLPWAARGLGTRYLALVVARHNLAHTVTITMSCSASVRVFTV